MGHMGVQVDSQARLHTISNSSTDRLLLLLLLLQVMGSKAVEPLDDEQLLMLRRVFQMFDSSKRTRSRRRKCAPFSALWATISTTKNWRLSLKKKPKMVTATYRLHACAKS